VFGVAAYDKAGNVSAISNGSISVDAVAPGVAITVPSAEGQTFGSQPTFSAIASDAAGVQRVEFLVDGVLQRTVTTAPYNAPLNLSAFSDGPHTLEVRAYDHFKSSSDSRGFVLDTAPTITSSTWPKPADWRQAVSGSLSVTAAVDPSTFSGYRYRFDRTAGSAPTLSDPAALASLTGNTTFSYNFLVQGGILAVPSVDGNWYFHVRTCDAANNLGSTAHYRIMIDTTAPTVPALNALPTAWQGTNSVAMSWGASTDALSGLATYVVYVNGAEAFRTTQNTVPVTGLHQGSNTVAVAALDRAGNLSAKASGTVKVDSIAPTVTISSPKNRTVVGAHPTFTAVPSDAAGISKVVFQIDSLAPTTVTRSPWSITPNLTSLSNTSHVLKVTAYDMYGRASSPAYATFWVDKTAPSLSVRSVAPTPFFPKLRDNYADDLFFAYTLGEYSRVTLRVTNSSGAVVRTISGSAKAGRNQFTWNGENGSGNVVAAGDYAVRVIATDPYGNTSTTRAYGVQVRYFILKRLASNKVQVILH
jgi:hypothetical protein